MTIGAHSSIGMRGLLLYGTDAPYGFPAEAGEPGYDYGRIKGWVERLPIPSDKREAIFAANLRALLSR